MPYIEGWSHKKTKSYPSHNRLALIYSWFSCDILGSNKGHTLNMKLEEWNHVDVFPIGSCLWPHNNIGTALIYHNKALHYRQRPSRPTLVTWIYKSTRGVKGKICWEQEADESMRCFFYKIRRQYYHVYKLSWGPVKMVINK